MKLGRKEPDIEGLAIPGGPESCAGVREGAGEVLTGGKRRLQPRGESAGRLRFRHVGLVPRLSCYEVCESGWEHFPVSLLDYAERGAGSPFR